MFEKKRIKKEKERLRETEHWFKHELIKLLDIIKIGQLKNIKMICLHPRFYAHILKNTFFRDLIDYSKDRRNIQLSIRNHLIDLQITTMISDDGYCFVFGERK